MNKYKAEGELYELIFSKIEGQITSGTKVSTIISHFYNTLDEYEVEVIKDSIPLSININRVVYHGVANDRIIEDGDLVTIDICCSINGFFIDGAKTLEVGSSRFSSFIDVSKKAISVGLEALSRGARVAEIIKEIDEYVGLSGYYLYPDGIGHGIGSKLHVRPFISMNYYDDFIYKFSPGDVLTLEPIILLKKEMVVEDSKGQGTISHGNLSTQFEVTILIDKDLSPVVINKALIK